MLPGGSEISWVRTLLRTSPEEVRATLEGQVDPKKKDQPTSQLAGTKRAGLEGFEPPTHGPGNRLGAFGATSRTRFFPAKGACPGHSPPPRRDVDHSSNLYLTCTSTTPSQVFIITVGSFQKRGLFRYPIGSGSTRRQCTSLRAPIRHLPSMLGASIQEPFRRG